MTAANELHSEDRRANPRALIQTSVDYFADGELLVGQSIDLGGGGLGSAGRNRIFDNVNAVESFNYDVVAKNNWWGDPEGPSSFLLEGSATFDYEPFFTEEPGTSEETASINPTHSLKTTWGQIKRNSE